MSELNRLVVRNVPKPVLELDAAANAVYIRFRTGKVKRTVSDDRRGAVVAIDFDAKDEIIGIEVVGVKEFSIRAIRRALPQRFQRIDFEGAKLAPTPA